MAFRKGRRVLVDVGPIGATPGDGRSREMRTDACLRVLYVIPVGERGGAEAVLLNIIKNHDQKRFTPLVCLLREGPIVNDLKGLGIKVISVPVRRLRNLLTAMWVVRRIRQILRAERIDLVFSNMAMGHVYGGLAAVGTPTRSVWFQHTISSGEALDRLAALIPADRLYVNSYACLRSVERLRPRANRVEILYPGVEVDSFPELPEPSRVREELGIPRQAPLVAAVGRLQRGKGQHILLEAALLVRRGLPETRFLFVGDTQFGLEPDYRQELRDLVTKYGLDNSVIFTGWRTDVPSILGAVDVLAHPAISPEGFGLVVAEAMARGKPVVVSNQGGLREIVTEGSTGFLVASGDAGMLADRILRLLNDPELRLRIGNAGKQRISERFSTSRMIGDLESSYIQMLCGEPELAFHE